MSRSFLPLFLAAALFLAGCATREPLPTFFVLTRGDAAPTGSSGGLDVAIKAVVLPAYLGSTQKIATRDGQNGIHYSLTERWAEPLDSAIAHGLAESLSRQPGIGRVGVGPAAKGRELRVTIERFEGEKGGTVNLIARWTLLAPGGGSDAVSGTSQQTLPAWKPGDYVTLAADLTAELDTLSAEIAQKIRSR